MMPSRTDAARAPFHALANARYEIVVTPSGGGFSAYDGFLLTAWRPDPVDGNGGVILYIRDLDNGEFWSASGRPLPGQAPGQIGGGADEITIARSHREIDSRVAIRLHPALGLEERRCRFTNRSARSRRIEVTSLVEVVLNLPIAHASHPAFSKLFVQTAVRHGGTALLATRRPRDPEETTPCLLHALLDAPVTDFSTDRATFIGRAHDLDRPHALADVAPLGRSAGNVLDPALSLRTELELAPGATLEIRFLLAAGYSEDDLSKHFAALRQCDLGTIAGSETNETAHRPAATSSSRFLTELLTRGLEPAHDPSMRLAPPAGTDEDGESKARIRALRYFNGYGGFSADGREYVIPIPNDSSSGARLPPAPWTNVIANPHFGCIVSETGAGTTWSGNSREYRLTPWSNDAVVDPHDDALYIRDQESRRFWSPQAGPARTAADVETTHGFGYSQWRQVLEGLEQTVTVFVPPADPVRVSRVQVRNLSGRPRRLAFFAYNRWVLGGLAEQTQSALRVAYDRDQRAILARNPESAAPGRIAFAAATLASLDSWSTDRAAFLGVPGSAAAPAAVMSGGRLGSTAGDQSCAVLLTTVEIPAGSECEVSFLLGECASNAALERLLAKYRSDGEVEKALQESRDAWSGTFERLQIRTPSAALDLMVNGWLPYQNIACRLWARSAFYQSGGAFGFRDQIQDAAALIYLRPDLTRAQILLHAAHQFVEGDVLHWWHPPDDRGLRTRFVDDLLWLALATAHYLKVTGDRSLLDVEVPFVTSRPLERDEGEAFIQARPAAETADVYEHCCRAIDRSLARGMHGLPLFGVGDWNDGMNRVGKDGRGESVWMGFFLYAVLGEFLPACESRDDRTRIDRYRAHRDLLRAALNADGWDGAWYRRGWYDNGAPLGSSTSDECRIDALAQAWAVISGAAPADRVESALDAVESHLIDDAERLIRLLTPPFVDTPNDPGYIKGYVAGVRENGGQYTHAATWVVRAMAEAGRRDRAMALMEALNPIHHSLDRAAADKYRVEPYVIAADIYGAQPHVGRGGWTWYTGSAGWMYRVAIETLLGFGIEGGETLCLQPRIPDHWPGFELTHRRPDGTELAIEVLNPTGRASRVVEASLDGATLAVQGGALRTPLPKTGGSHRIVVVLGE